MFRISQLTLLSWDNMVFRVTDYDLVFFFHAHPFVDGFYVHWNFELQILLLNIWDVSIEHKFLHISVVWKTWTCDTQIQKNVFLLVLKYLYYFCNPFRNRHAVCTTIRSLQQPRPRLIQITVFRYVAFDFTYTFFILENLTLILNLKPS